jgi:DNA polymerase III sliding clamp (beta) subunit (PCNA family)
MCSSHGRPSQLTKGIKMKSEITLRGAELKIALSGLNKITGRKTSLPVLSHLKVTRQKNGQVSLQGTDPDAFATYHFEGSQPGEPVELLVPMDQLNQAFKANTSKQDMTLVCDGAVTKLRYRLGGNLIEQPVNTLPVSEWPPAPKLTGENALLPPGFGEALKQAFVCCSDSRPVLQGACLDARDKNGHYIVASDGLMLYAANSFTFPFAGSVTIPDSKFLTGSGLLDADVCFLSVQPGKKKNDVKRISLRNQQWDFVTREVEGPFPEWKQHLVKFNDRWTRIQLKPEAVASLLKVIPNLPGKDGQHQVVSLRVDKVLTVAGQNKSDTEPTMVDINDVVITGKAKKISLNREYLLNALRFGFDEVAVMDELSPLVISQAGRQMVIMPVNPNGTQTPKSAPQPSTTPRPVAEAPNERKTEMPRTNSSTTPPATPKAPEPSTSLLDQIEQVKESAKNLVRDLAGLTDTVKQAEKDRRTNEKELENARAVLKKLQQVQI